MHRLLLIPIILLSVSGMAQDCYWQQRVSYVMDIDFDVKSHRFEGAQRLEYTNNSPDTLHRVFYHLYFNAFQPGSMMDARSQSISDPDPRISDRISRLNPDEAGYHTIQSITQNGRNVTCHISGTIAEVWLDEPVQPGGSTVLEMEFESQVPIQIRRSGRNNREGVDYTMTQWYPKLAEYDRDGWHTLPYVAREFHGVFGTFEVNITIDSKYILAGTGVVQNPEEVGHGYAHTKPSGKKTTWRFRAENVHDFAWAADPEYRHLKSSLDNGTEIHFFHLRDSTLNAQWDKLIPYTVKMFEIMNDRFGVYPYEQFSVIQGGDGGMEYPMCTMITSSGSFGGLVSVTVHEAIHNWFYGVLASNESKYPWMDEGFTTYAQHIVLDSLFKRRRVNPHERSYASYISNASSGSEVPLSTPADHYETNKDYGVNAYSKGCVFLHQLSYIVGQDIFDKAMLRYFEQWKFRHPAPSDFKRVMEKASDMELDWYFDAWIGTTQTIDYAIHNLISDRDKTIVEIERKGAIPMPLELEVIKKEGVEIHHIPLEIMRNVKAVPGDFEGRWIVEADWPWTYPYYQLVLDYPVGDIVSIKLNPQGKVADLDPGNESYPSDKVIFKSK